MSVFAHLFDRSFPLTHASRRAGRRRATLEARVALLETELSELETMCKTLIGIVREAGVMTDDRIEALLAEIAKRPATDPAGDALERAPQA